MMKVTIPNALLAPFPIPYSLVNYRSRIDEFNNWNRESFHHFPVGELVKARVVFVDFVLQNLWTAFKLSDEKDLSLLAVGGYGRGELHPESDIDLLFLSEKKLPKKCEDNLSSFITTLWDLKFDIGHAVRTLKETIKIGKEDITIATNMMERRLITGNTSGFEKLEEKLNYGNFIDSKTFYLAKRDEQEKRHSQYHSTSYNLEPNLKANPGCLRDIQTISWVAKKHFNTQSVRQLVAHGYMSSEEYTELEECQDFLWQIRFALHLIAQRSENRLLFDYQPQVAELMGFGEPSKASVERMMKRFFRVARRVIELNTMLLQRFNSSILGISRDVSILNDDFEIRGTAIKARHENIFFYRENIFKMFIHIADNPVVETLHSETIHLLRNARRRLLGDLQDMEKCRSTFMAFLRHPNAMGQAFALMLKHSVLSCYLPNWRQIVGQMQFDLFHAYTVDEHTHRLIKNLHRFSQPEHSDEFPICSDIFKKIDKPEILYIAGIFHDIGKGRGGDHSELGAIDAKSFCNLHGINKSDSDLISWLVNSHLMMSMTTQKQDIYEPSVIEKFAKTVKSSRYLDHLYCLTVADVRATNTNLWNDWKATLLADLYKLTRKLLIHGMDSSETNMELAESHKQAALSLLSQDTATQEQVQQLWKPLKTLYFSRHEPEQISWHASQLLAHKNRETTPLVLVSDQAVRGGTQVMIYAKVQKGIFDKIVNVFDVKNINIVDAYILNTKDGYLLDTFTILEQDSSMIDFSDRRLDIKQSLENILMGKSSQRRIKQLSSRQVKHFDIPVTVNYRDSASNHYDIIEINALDTHGLLAKISSVFTKLNIKLYSAKIHTLGERAEDIFTISNEQRNKLSQQQKDQLTEALKQELTSI